MSPADTEQNPSETPESPTASPQAATEAPPEANPDCRREVSVEIPAEVVSREFESTLRKYSKAASMPGFRKGKAPQSIVRNRYADDIRKEVLDHLLPEYYQAAIAKEGFTPVSDPGITKLEMDEGKPIRFTAVFEVLPEIELGNYREIKVEKPQVQVKDEEVEAELKQLQERQASFDPVEEERPLHEGDFAQVSFQAVPKEESAAKPAEGEEASTAQPAEAAQPASMDEVLVEIGGAATLPEFTENLRGAKLGEERTFDISYPADYNDQRLAGKVFSYTVKVNGIKKKSTPALDDAFAKELSQEFKTLDELKQRLREGMEAERKHRAEHEARDKILNELADRHDFPVPEVLVRRQIDYRLEQWLRSLAAQGMRTEDMKRMDFRRLRLSQRPAALKEVKSNLLLEKVAEAENIQVSDEEISREVMVIAQQMNQTPETVLQRLEETGNIERVRARLRTQKALELLYNQGALAGNAENSSAQQ